MPQHIPHARSHVFIDKSHLLSKVRHNLHPKKNTLQHWVFKNPALRGPAQCQGIRLVENVLRYPEPQHKVTCAGTHAHLFRCRVLRRTYDGASCASHVQAALVQGSNNHHCCDQGHCILSKVSEPGETKPEYHNERQHPRSDVVPSARAETSPSLDESPSPVYGS